MDPYNNMGRHTPHPSSPPRGEERFFDLCSGSFLSPARGEVDCRAGILPANLVMMATSPDHGIEVKMAALQNDAVASGALALQFRRLDNSFQTYFQVMMR
jgi:hypothetical protein